ncbi:MAG: RNA polymerase sigma factor [Planctomycetota bacterium]
MQPKPDKPVIQPVTAIHASQVPLDGADDGMLASLVANGDRSAAAELVRRHQAAVRGFLRVVCYDRSATDDLAQETFLRAIRYAERYDPKYPMRGWLLTIARRLSINHGNKTRRRRPAAGVELERVVSDTAQPDAGLDEAEQQALTKRMVADAMQKLSEPQRIAIALHYQQGLPLEEIAHRLAMPIGTVKSHLHRGRKRMKQLLQPGIEEVLS